MTHAHYARLPALQPHYDLLATDIVAQLVTPFLDETGA
jgi:hypothetical protein